MAVAQPERTRRVALYDAYVYDDQVPSFFRWAQQSAASASCCSALFYDERIEDRAPLAYYDERWVTQARVDRVERELDRPGTTAAALATARGHHFAELHEQAARRSRKPVLLLWGARGSGHAARASASASPTSSRTRSSTSTALRPHPDGRGAHTRRPAISSSSSTNDRALPEPRRHRRVRGTEPAPVPAVAAVGGRRTVAGDRRCAGCRERRSDLPSDPRRFRPAAARRRRQAAARCGSRALGAELTPRLYAAPREHDRARRPRLAAHARARTSTTSISIAASTRSGKPLFPVPLGGGQALDGGDLRARTDLAIYAPGVGVAVKARIDWLDNVALGGEPGSRRRLARDAAAASARRPSSIKRAWGEALTPFGTLAVGRMGAHFGLGIAANGGDCEDCDHGDSADRARVRRRRSLGHLLAIAYDITSSGPFTPRKDGGRAIALEPSDAVAGPTLAILKVHSPAALARRAAAGLDERRVRARTSRTARRIATSPRSYLPTAAPRDRRSRATTSSRAASPRPATGGWLRISARAVPPRGRARVPVTRASRSRR